MVDYGCCSVTVCPDWVIRPHGYFYTICILVKNQISYFLTEHTTYSNKQRNAYGLYFLLLFFPREKFNRLVTEMVKLREIYFPTLNFRRLFTRKNFERIYCLFFLKNHTFSLSNDSSVYGQWKYYRTILLFTFFLRNLWFDWLS